MSVSTIASPISSSNDEDFIVNYLTYDNFTISIANIDQNARSPHSLSSTCTQTSGSEISYEYLTQNYSRGIEVISNDLIITGDQNSFINGSQISSETEDESMLDMSSNDYQNCTESRPNIIENIIIANPSDLLASLPVVTPSAKTSQSFDAQEEYDDDDSDNEELTNLTWLTELKNITNLTPSDQPLTDQPTQRFNKFISQVRRIRETYDKRSDVYRNSASEKPPFNYAQIIAMAMLEEGRMTLQRICKWIQDNFAYYKVHKNWNNSIRHNLSLNFFFTKVARDKNEKGKGGYWELAMDVTKSEKKRVRQRRRNKDNIVGTRNDNVSIKTRFNSSNKKFSMKLNENQTDKNKKMNSEGKSNDDKNFKVSMTKSNNNCSIDEMAEESEDDYNNNNSVNNNFEVIEEQQNINNIIDETHNAIIISPIMNHGPNVIVEAIPTYHFPQIETLDDNELNRLISMNEQDLIDDFLNYNESDIIKEDEYLVN